MRFLVFFFILIHFLSCGNKNSETLIKSKTGSIYKLAGTINGYSNRPFFIYGFYGFESFPVDSGITGDKGELKWTIPPDWNPGLYRLVFESFNQNQIETGEKHLDFIIKRENIEFSTYYQYLVDSLKITESNENKGFYEFLKKRDLYKLKVNVLTRTLFSYPAKDKFYSQISRQLNRLKKRFSNFTENLISKNKNLLFTRIVQINKIPDIPDNLPGNLADKYSRDKHLLYTNFADTFLLRTPFIAEKILTYLTLYRNDALSESDQAEAYKNAVDNIMLKASVNEDFFYKIAEYLINGFESLNMLAVSEHISSQYILGSVCNRDNIPASLRERAENLKKLAVGMPSPDFDFVTSEGQALSLYKIDSQTPY